MAIIAKKDDKKNQQNVGTTQSVAAPLSNQNQQQNRTAGTGRFQNLQNFVGANKDFNLGGKVGDAVYKKSEPTQSKIATQRKDLTSQYEGEKSRIGRADELTGMAVNDPQKLLAEANANNRQQFEQIRSGDYTDPRLQNVAGLQSATNQLQGLENRTMTEQGRFGLLRDTFGLPGYSQGAQRADQLLLQSDPSQLQYMRDRARAAYTDTQSALDDALSAEKAYSGEISGLAGEASTEANRRLREAAEGRLSDIDKAYQDALSQSTAFSDFLAGNRELTDEELRNYMDVDAATQAANAAEWRIYDTLKDPTANYLWMQGITPEALSPTQRQYYTDKLMSPEASRYRELQQQFDQARETGAWDLAYNPEAAAIKEEMDALSAQGYNEEGLRNEYVGQLRNEVNRLTSQLSSDDLRRAGMTRDQINNLFDQSMVGESTLDQVELAKRLSEFGPESSTTPERLFGTLRNMLGVDADKVASLYEGPEAVTREQAASAGDIDYLEAINQLAQQQYGTDQLDFQTAREQTLGDLFGRFDIDELNRITGDGRFDETTGPAYRDAWLNRL